MQNAPAGKTHIIVTDALHFLPAMDYIFAMNEGRIVKHGTYNELMANNGAFSKFVQEFGSKEENEDEKGEMAETVGVFLHDGFVDSNTGVVVNISRFCEADDRVDKDILDWYISGWNGSAG